MCHYYLFEFEIFDSRVSMVLLLWLIYNANYFTLIISFKKARYLISKDQVTTKFCLFFFFPMLGARRPELITDAEHPVVLQGGYIFSSTALMYGHSNMNVCTNTYYTTGFIHYPASHGDKICSVGSISTEFLYMNTKIWLLKITDTLYYCIRLKTSSYL